MPRQQTPSDRPLWLAIIFIMAVLAAAATGLALHSLHASPVLTLTGTGSAFVAAMTLGIAGLGFLGP